MGVELLDLLVEDYCIVSYHSDSTTDLLKNKGFPVVCYKTTHTSENMLGGDAIVRVLKNKRFMKKIGSHKGTKSHTLFFYTTREMESLSKSYGISLLLPPVQLQKKLGDKLSLEQFCKQMGIKTNTTIAYKRVTYTPSHAYEDCVQKLGLPFVIQSGFGASGESIYKIHSAEEFLLLSNKISGGLRASRYVENSIPLSVHICITRTKILFEGPYLQIVGFPELSQNPFQFCGNDMNQHLLTQKVKTKIKSASIKLAQFSRTLGYRGILGIDFLLDPSNGEVYVQEINSRLVGLTRLLTGVQKEQKITPHLISHIQQFIPLNNLKGFVEGHIKLNGRSYSQLYIANNAKMPRKAIHSLPSGIYSLIGNKLVLKKESLFIADMTRGDIMCTFAIHKGGNAQPSDIIAKIILKESAIEKNTYRLTKKARRIVALIRKYILG